MLSNFNHLLGIDAYSTQWMDDTHMRHIKYFRTERIAVCIYIYTNYDIYRPIFVLYMPFKYIRLCMKLPFPTKKYLDMKVRFRIFQSNPSTNMFLFKSDSVEPCRTEAVMHKYRLLSKKGLRGILQPRPKPCEPRAHI